MGNSRKHAVFAVCGNDIFKFVIYYIIINTKGGIRNGYSKNR